jgi:hypothetical protein
MVLSNRLVRFTGLQRTQSSNEEYLSAISSCIRRYTTALSILAHNISKEQPCSLRGRHFATAPEEDGPQYSTGKQVYDRMVDLPKEGIATLQDKVSFKDTWHSGKGIKEAVGGKVLGLYVDVPKDSVREALHETYYHPDLTKAKIHQYNYGCTGALEEFEASGKPMCMYRESLSTVMQTILGSTQGARMDVLLDGWTGSGKSVSLYALVAAARENGWVVMYIPSASLLVRGGVYKKKDEDDSHWYTPIAASHIVQCFYNSHSADVLQTLPSADGKSTLRDQCAQALEKKDDFHMVDTTVQVLQGLLKADGTDGVRTLVVVDDYNYLYHQTEYFETMHRFHRRRIDPGELVLASAFRLLQDNRKSGIVAAAPSYGKSISPTIPVPLVASTKTIRIPRFSMEEVSSMASMLVSQKKLPNLPPDAALKRALALANGNAKELRQNRATLFSPDNGLEMSVPYSRR